MNNFEKWQLFASLMFSACAALIYEIGVTQVLFFYFIESSYSLATVMAIFLGGLGLGSFLIYKCQAKIKDKRLLLGLLQLTVSLYSFLVLTRLWVILPHLSLWGIFLVCLIVLAVPTTLIGGVFPLALSLSRNKKDQETGGLIYSIDLAGAIAGSLLVGFLIIPRFGVTFSILIGAVFNLISAFLVIPGKWKIFPPAVFLLYLFLAKYDIVNVFPYRVVTGYQFYKNSQFGAITVVNDTLYINNREQCSLHYGDKTSERKMVEYALEPFKNKKKEINVLSIGLGCGMTLSNILDYKQAKPIVVEINPVVVEANKTFSEVLKNPRVNLLIQDGLSYLRSNKRKFNTILIDVEDPTVAHASNLYTVDAFKLVASSLEDDGTFALWNYEMALSSSVRFGRYLDILYYSLKEAFPYIYKYPRVMVGSKKKLDIAEYQPLSPKEINTIDKNVLTEAFMEEWSSQLIDRTKDPSKQGTKSSW